MYSFEGVPERLVTETSPEGISLFRREFTCANRLAPTIHINANVTAVVHLRLRQIETRPAFVLDSCFLDIASPLKDTQRLTESREFEIPSDAPHSRENFSYTPTDLNMRREDSLKNTGKGAV